MLLQTVFPSPWSRTHSKLSNFQGVQLGSCEKILWLLDCTMVIVITSVWPIKASGFHSSPTTGPGQPISDLYYHHLSTCHLSINGTYTVDYFTKKKKMPSSWVYLIRTCKYRKHKLSNIFSILHLLLIRNYTSNLRKSIARCESSSQ